jgi:hypothetical protein
MNYKNIIPEVDGWMSDRCCEFLYTLARQMESIAEVGSWKGRSTHPLCSGCNGTVIAIDNWGGSAGDGLVIPEKERATDAVFQKFLKNTAGLKNLIVNRNDSVVAAAQYPDKFFDMVFIDAEHTYESVKADLEAWTPKAKKLICGHDYHVTRSAGGEDVFPGVARAVDEKFGTVETMGIIWFKWLEGGLCELK